MKKTAHASWFAALLLVGALAWLFVDASRFSEEDIANLKESVRTEFAKQPGVTVMSVEFVRESDRKLTGFAKLNAQGTDVTKPCTATMGDDRRFIWRCE